MTLDAFGRLDVVGIARMIRPACSDCGGPCQYGRLSEVTVDGTPEQQAAFEEGRAWLSTSIKGDPVVWRCRRCSALGIFADIEAEIG